MRSKYAYISLAVALLIAAGTIGSAAAVVDQTGSFNGLKNGCGKALGRGIDFIAKALNTDAETIKEQRRQGKSIAEIAQAKGLSTEELSEKVLEARKTAIEEAVKQGRLTREQADAIIARIESCQTGAAFENCGMGGGRRGNGCSPRNGSGSGCGPCGNL